MVGWSCNKKNEACGEDPATKEENHPRDHRRMDKRKQGKTTGEYPCVRAFKKIRGECRGHTSIFRNRVPKINKVSSRLVIIPLLDTKVGLESHGRTG